MTRLALFAALASASALGMVATPAEIQRGRLMRAPDHGSGHEYPKWAYGAGGASGIFNSADEIPAGWEDHPSKVGTDLGDGVHTPIVSANGSVSEAKVAKSTTAESDTIVDPLISAQSGVGGMGSTPATGDTASKTTAPKAPRAPRARVAKPKAAEAPKTAAPAAPKTPAPAPADNELDAHGHPFNPELHAATRSKTKDNLWRMKVGKSRPAALPGFPLDL